MFAVGVSPAVSSDGTPKLLPPHPGLDNGEGGHWGKQQEKDWVDNRWNQMDVGPMVSSILRVPNGTIAKGLSIRVGANGEAAVCYDTHSPNLRAGWLGKFISFSPARYGLIERPNIVGDFQFTGPSSNAWSGPVQYSGLYRHGKRVVLHYRVDDASVFELPWAETRDGLTVFTRVLEVGPLREPTTLNTVERSGASAKIIDEAGLRIAVAERDGSLVALAMVPEKASATLTAEAGRLGIALPSSPAPQRVKLCVWRGPREHLARFAAVVRASASPENVELLTRGGVSLWPELPARRGQVALTSDAYVIDTLPVPYENPWKALMFLSGIDFFENGDAAVSTLHGDVWVVSGIDEKLQNVRWKRFATGLFQPLGLKIVRGRVHVLGRDQITALEDRNGDGEADWYENFCNQIRTSEEGHDYVTSLEADPAGNFYYVDPRGLHRISTDSRRHETIASGWRNPNGMSVGPDGMITVAPQEGEWTPGSALCEVKPGGHYGFGGPRVTPERPLGYDPPLCWIPRHIDNSSGSQVWVTSDRWGPLAGQLLNLSFGRCSMMLVLREVVDGQAQGGVVPLKGRFISGAMRGAFRRQDGQLYVAGTRGWVSSALRDGCLQRVRYTGAKVHLPIALRACSNGLRITFTQPLDRRTAEDTGSYGIEQWNYRYGKEYGSKEYSVVFPDQVGHDPVDVRCARVLPDGNSVFLEIPNLRPVMQMAIQYNIHAADGKTMRGEILNTINRLGEASQQ
ncbi:MAG: hypothetical protein L0Y58_05240 [Verrucomicrobia subdivision 3 bacterium]|nr:hypothetical protein [Limisphaerales bacterium]